TNTFGGAGKNFTLTSGTVNINAAQALGNLNNQIIINGGTIASSTTGITLSTYIGTGGINLNGDFTFGGTTALNMGVSTVTLGGNRSITVTNAGGVTLGGAIVDGGAGRTLTIAAGSTGLLTFSGSSANTYGGLTTINAGELDLAKTGTANAIGSGGLSING